MNNKVLGNETIILEMLNNGHFKTMDKSVINRGFLFGDGLFETMIYSRGSIRYKEAHLSRLKEGCHILQIDLDDFEYLKNIEEFLMENFPSLDTIRIRWNVFREGMGRYTPESNLAVHQFTLQAHQHTGPSVKKAYITQSLKVPSLPWSNCKTLNALVYVMANHERQIKKLDEVILLSSDGYVCEAGAANLFWIRDSVYYTPSLRSNCIAGIGRSAIMAELRDRGIELIQGEFKPKDFLSADQVFTSNVTGIHYISQIDVREFDTTPIPFLEKLFNDL